MNHIIYIRVDGFYVKKLGLEVKGPACVLRDDTVVDVSLTAEMCGVKRGMKPGVARRVCPHLVVFPWENDYNTEVEGISSKLTSLTPCVEAVDFHESLISCHASGVRETLEALLPWVGYRIVAAKASNRFAAKVAGYPLAKGAGVILRRVKKGDERRFVAPFPIDLLDVPMTVRESLKRIGIHRLGDLFSLSLEDLESMYCGWAKVIDRCRYGQGDTTVKQYTTSPWVVDGCLNYPLEALPLRLEEKLKALCSEMEQSGLGLGFISLTLSAPGSSFTRRRVFPERVSRLPGLIYALSSIIKTIGSGAPIFTRYRLEAGGVGPITMHQGDLFGKTPVDLVVESLRRRYGHSIIGTGGWVCRRERMLALWDPMRGRL